MKKPIVPGPLNSRIKKTYFRPFNNPEFNMVEIPKAPASVASVRKRTDRPEPTALL